MMHGSSPWMLGEEEGFFGDLIGRTSRRHSDGCGRTTRSGGGGNMSSGESEFLRKRNLKEGRELMWRRIVRLSTPGNGRWRVKFFNASILGRREEGAMPISEGERST
jgi:hypothetical protein